MRYSLTPFNPKRPDAKPRRRGAYLSLALCNLGGPISILRSDYLSPHLLLEMSQFYFVEHFVLLTHCEHLSHCLFLFNLYIR